MAAHNETGKWGERVAARYMEKQGYVIRDTDWHYGKRDLDIVAITPAQDVLVIVEVKTRSDDGVMDPMLAVNEAKIRNLAIAANAYVKQYAVESDIRFDIITVVGIDEAHCKVRHVEEAFNPLLLSSWNTRR